mmetsp:Transcript_82846/g.96847  ORF Transcript_82846/g.96847 Transcript_82846/m.96847 type:complete len:338 (+) Transcript_82846:37-1050(+)
MRVSALTFCVLLVCTFQVFAKTSIERIADLISGIASSVAVTVDANALASNVPENIAETLLSVLTETTKLSAYCDAQKVQPIMEQYMKLITTVSEAQAMAVLANPGVQRVGVALGLSTIPPSNLLDTLQTYILQHTAELCTLANELNLEITNDAWSTYGNSIGTIIAKIVATYKPTRTFEANFLEKSGMEQVADLLTGVASATTEAGTDFSATMKCFDEELATAFIGHIADIAAKYANCDFSKAQDDSEKVKEWAKKVTPAQSMCIITDPALRKIFGALTKTESDFWSIGAKVISYYYVNKAEVCATFAQLDVDCKAGEFGQYGSHLASQWMKMWPAN